MTAPIGTNLPGRCTTCGMDPRPEVQGHRLPCTPTGHMADLLLARQRMDGRAGARTATEQATPDREWQTFLTAVRADAAANAGLVSQNRIRESIGHRWTTTNAKRRYSQMWARARREGLLVETDATERSTDHAGGNAHRIVPVLRLNEQVGRAAA